MVYSREALGLPSGLKPSLRVGPLIASALCEGLREKGRAGAVWVGRLGSVALKQEGIPCLEVSMCLNSSQATAIVSYPALQGLSRQHRQ